MKKNVFLFLACLSIGFTNTTEAQIWKKIKQKVDRKVERKIDKKVNKKIDDIFDKKKKGKEKDEPKNEEKKLPDISEEDNTLEKPPKEINKDHSLELWNSYDFIPADNIIIYSDLKFEDYGDFPAQWDLAFGNAEIAKLGGEKVIQLKEGGDCTMIMPLITKEDYVEGYTTLEFDMYLDELFFNHYSRYYWYIGFYDISTERYYGSTFIDGDGKKQGRHTTGGKITFHILNGQLRVGFGNRFNGSIAKNQLSHKTGWHHVAVAVNDKSLKFYIDEHKLLNIPNINFNPFKLFIGLHNKKNMVAAVKNIKIAQGGGKPYKRILTDGKFVTTGILFDSGKATLKPQSAGVLKKVTDMLVDNPTWNFEIIGHTDSDGDEVSNQKLSEDRAVSIKQALIKNGILATHLTTSGKGESEPLNTNSTTEEKANNRRVVFILKK